MQGPNWEVIGQAVGIVGAVLVGIWGVVRGHRKGSGEPPEHRQPGPHELRAALASLSDKLDKHEEVRGEDMTDLRRDVARIERMLERMSDRIDTDARIGAAIAKLARDSGQ